MSHAEIPKAVDAQKERYETLKEQFSIAVQTLAENPLFIREKDPDCEDKEGDYNLGMGQRVGVYWNPSGIEAHGFRQGVVAQVYWEMPYVNDNQAKEVSRYRLFLDGFLEASMFEDPEENSIEHHIHKFGGINPEMFLSEDDYREYQRLKFILDDDDLRYHQSGESMADEFQLKDLLEALAKIKPEHAIPRKFTDK